MDLLKRTISLVLVFQLCWACNGSYSKSSSVVNTGGSSSTGTLTISGTISSLMNLVMTSAIAQTGDIVVQDITDPDNPIELHKETLNGTNSFTVSLKKTDVSGGRLIKASYISSDDPSQGSRSLLFNVAGTEATVNASMDSDTTLNSVVFEQQLQQEKSRGEISGSDFLKRFKEIKNDDYSDEFESLGSDKSAIKKLVLDPNFAPEMADLLANLKYARTQGDLDSLRDYKEKLFLIASEKSFISKAPILNCSANDVSILFRDQSLSIIATGLDLVVMQKLGVNYEIGSFGDIRTASDEVNKYLLKLAEIGKGTGKIVSANLYFSSKDGIPFSESCRVFSEPMKASDEASASLPEFEFEINRSKFNSFDANVFANIGEAHIELLNIYIESLKNLREQIKTAVASNQVDSNDAQFIYAAGMRNAGDLYDEKFFGVYNTFFPAHLEKNPYELNLSFEKNISFDAFTADFSGAYVELDRAFQSSVEDLKYRISNDRVDPASYEYDRSYSLLKHFHEVKKEQLDWWASNYNL